MRNHANSLPNEILSEIFRLTIGNPVSFKYSYNNKSRANIVLVCKAWSNALLSTKSLWSSIVIEAIDRREPNGKLITYGFADLSFLHNCLTLSYPLPLTIKIHVEEDDDQREEAILPVAMRLLMAHAIRWRTFSCIGPPWLFDTLRGLDGLRMPKLEALTLESSDVLPSAFTQGQPIVLSPRLRHFDTNFNTPRMVPTWSALVSLSSGFTSNDQCYEILSLLSNIVTLAIIHVDVAQPYTQHKPLTMGGLRCLKLAECAVPHVLEDVYFPSLNEFHLVQAIHLRHHLDYRAQCLQPDPMREERLRSILERPGTLLRVLDICSRDQLSTMVVPLLPFTNDTLSVLRVSLRTQSYLDTRIFLNFLTTTTTDHPVLPNLSELHLHVDYQTEIEALLLGGSLEGMLVSRCDIDEVGRNVCSLRQLHIWGDDFNGYDSEDEIESGIQKEETYRQSSLALLLKELSDHRLPFNKRLDVKWMFGDIDILKSGGTPDYFNRVFSGDFW